MGFGETLVLITLIICVSILFGFYMFTCYEKEITMFSDPDYENSISKLEKVIKENN